MSEPRVALLLPVYNRAEFVLMTIDSITQQTFQNFEVLAVDDASTDGSFDLLIETAKTHPTRWHVFRNARNLGAAANANRCLALQREKLPHVTYLIKVDAGTALSPGLLATGVEILDQDRTAVMCHFRTYIESSGDVHDTALSGFGDALAGRGFSRVLNHTMTSAEALFLFIRYDNFVSSSAALVRRDAFERLERPWYDEAFRLADYELWTRLAATGTIRYVADASVRCFRAPGMVSTMLDSDRRLLQQEVWCISVRTFFRSWRVLGALRTAKLFPVVALKWWWARSAEPPILRR